MRANRHVDNIEVNYDELDHALQESVRLQAHYANLLNMWDGGKRAIFNSTNDWIKRLREMRKEPND